VDSSRVDAVAEHLVSFQHREPVGIARIVGKEGTSRRRFLTLAGGAAALYGSGGSLASALAPRPVGRTTSLSESDPANYSLHIESSAVEIAPKHIVSTITYNGQFPGPLLRFKEGESVTVEVHNETNTPEQLHWHGQFVSTDVDGAAEEGTPFIAAHGMRRIMFTPRPAGFRFYHTHNRAVADLHAGQYSGQVGPVYIEPKHEPGGYDREVFLILKEFEPSFSQGGDRPRIF
jgi:FtsP/CotA-like multicopper oxidase with cupredoxin domain